MESEGSDTMKAADFLATLGVNTHVDSAPYDDTGRIVGALSYLGIHNIRQSSPIDAASFAGTQALGVAGEKIDLIVNGGGPVSLAGAMGDVDRLAPYLNAVENVNEVAIYPIQYAGLSGVNAAVELQKDLYAAVHGNPALAGVPVLSFTIGGADPSAFPSIGDISPWTDYANIHSYPPQGLRPIFVIHAAIDGGRTDALSRPVVVTETGYYTLQNRVGWGGVPQNVQAKYLLSEVLDEAAAGVKRTYLYDLLDDGNDPSGLNQEDHFGLFNFDGSPKQSAVAFHSLTTLLADTGPAASTFTPSAFSFSAQGVPYDYTGNTLLLDKSDGSHVVAVWNEQQTWNTGTLTSSTPLHYPVTVTFGRSWQNVLVFDSMQGTAPVQVLHDVSSVSLDLTDHPFLIQVMPDVPVAGPAPVASPVPALIPAPAPLPSPVATPIPTLSPSSTPVPATPVPASVPVPAQNDLVLHLSEDAWMGDAQFTVSVDDKQLGGTLTASALHAAGMTQDVVVSGLPTGSHQVALTFVNDAYGGTPATDRNLYVDGINQGGVMLPGSTAALMSNGTASFQVGQGGSAVSTQVSVSLSEDAWQGDAHASVAIDGRMLAADVAVTALHGQGASQTMTFMADLTPGAHVVSVGFLNDAWGGTADTDRNLYLGTVSVGGIAASESSAVLWSNGTAAFHVGAGGAAPALSQDPILLQGIVHALLAAAH